MYFNGVYIYIYKFIKLLYISMHYVYKVHKNATCSV